MIVTGEDPDGGFKGPECKVTKKQTLENADLGIIQVKFKCNYFLQLGFYKKC